MPSEGSFPRRAGLPAEGPSDEPAQYRDLCSSCDNAAEHAASGSRPQRPIFFCDEFAVFTASAPEVDRSVEEKPRETYGGGGRMGLCVNCEHAPSCTLPRPEGGVWHCEEYR